MTARPKIISQAQIIGEQGAAMVQARINEMGFLFTRYGPVEAGIDGLIELRDPATGQVSGRLVAVQVKTTESGGYAAESADNFEYVLRPEDLSYWQKSNLPVIIVLVRLSDRTLYWKTVPPVGNPESPEARRLRFDKSKDTLTSSASDEIAQLAVDQASPGTWVPPAREAEPLLLNAIRVVLPDQIYVAATEYSHSRDVLRALLDENDAPPWEWTARGGRFLSFLDPRSSPLDSVVDTGSVEDFPVSVFALHDDETEQRLFVELLNKTLRSELFLHLGLNWSDKARAFYFPAASQVIERTLHYTSTVKETDRRVVAARRRPDGSIAYVRHSAFSPRFWKMDDLWYLLIQPTYVFTWDGSRPDRYAGERISKLKRKERNASLRGQFVMWQSLLAGIGRVEPQLDLLPSSTLANPLLQFEAIDPFLSPAAVRDDLWRQRDEFAPQENEEELPL